MEKTAVDSWEEFEEKVRELHHGRRSRLAASGPRPSHFLFRGQEDASWKLRTTLERAGRTRMAYPDYYQLISKIHSEIASLGFGPAP